ncbi:MAG: FISUMP domain-containing protein, partial [Chitinophagales bacterium]
AGRSAKSPWWMNNFDYANKDTNPNPWFKIPYVGSFNDSPNDGHGAIFNYYAVEKCNVCPSGFRLPTEQEFMDMANAVGGRNLMSRTGEDWGAIGRIDGYGSVVRGRFGEYWTSTPAEEDYKARAFVFNSNGTFHVSSEDKRTGCYVRCIKEKEESTELNTQKFEMLAHSIHGGNDQGLWFLGVDKGEADQAVGTNKQIRIRIVKRASNGSVSTVDGKPAVILDIVPTDERNHGLGGHLYIFNAAGIGDGQYYLATGQNGDKNIYIRHKSTGSAATATEFAFRSHNAFTKDGTSGEFRSFESVVHPGHYLRHSYHKALLATKNLEDKVWRGDVSWKLVDPK